jgi:hypothetical protein
MTKRTRRSKIKFHRPESLLPIYKAFVKAVRERWYEPYYALKIDQRQQHQMRLLDNEINDDELLKQIPEDIREALSGAKSVKLDNALFKMLHYKKDDFDKRYAYPLIYAALSDLSL